MRLHVIAHSNKNQDQILKLKVRDQILNLMHDKLIFAKNKSQTKKILLDNINQINLCAQNTVFQNGYKYKIKTIICQDNFPTKTYGDIKFPAGNYDALKITIGDGKGQNFWCAIFPPLCFVDLTKKIMPENIKHDLKNSLSQNEYKLLCDSDKSFSIKIKFKLLEAFSNSNKKKIINLF